MLEGFGCAVTTVQDGFSALAAAQTNRFDLICLDRHMPGGGRSVAGTLAGAAFLVACTSDPDGHLPEFHLVIPKPLRREDVARAVAGARRWRVRREALGWSTRQALSIARRLAAILLHNPALAAEVRAMIASAASRSAAPMRRAGGTDITA
jgi:CheY-like chemotaxis protein